ncbi:MAG: hypothetical protein ABSE73_13290 [Planctomycetota bacterium]
MRGRFAGLRFAVGLVRFANFGSEFRISETHALGARGHAQDVGRLFGSRRANQAVHHAGRCSRVQLVAVQVEFLFQASIAVARLRVHRVGVHTVGPRQRDMRLAREGVEVPAVQLALDQRRQLDHEPVNRRLLLGPQVNLGRVGRLPAVKLVGRAVRNDGGHFQRIGILCSRVAVGPCALDYCQRHRKPEVSLAQIGAVNRGAVRTHKQRGIY